MNSSQSFAVVEVAEPELPLLLGVVEPLLEPLALLVPRDVQEDLDDRRPLVDEHALELADVLVPPAPDRLAARASRTRTATTSS